jgi:hypothetical protein
MPFSVIFAGINFLFAQYAACPVSTEIAGAAAVL